MSQSVKERFISKTISFRAGIAEHVGISAAIIFEHIIHWIEHNYRKQRKTDKPVSLHDGHWWMYESYDEMVEWIPFYERTCIVNGIAALEKAGYIVKGSNPRNKLDHTNWYRLSDELESQIIFTKEHFSADRQAKECSNDRTPDGLSSLSKKEDKVKQEQQQPAAPAAVFSSLKNLDMSEAEKVKISQAHPEPMVNEAVRWAIALGDKRKKPIAATIKWWCAEASEGRKPENAEVHNPDENKKYAESVLNKVKFKSDTIVFSLLNKYVELYDTTSAFNECLHYSDKKFREKLENILRKIAK